MCTPKTQGQGKVSGILLFARRMLLGVLNARKSVTVMRGKHMILPLRAIIVDPI